MIVGFSNWKDATVSFRNHESSSFHKEAVVTLPSTTQMLESFCQSNMLQKNRTIGTVCLKSYNAFGFCVDKDWPSEVMMMIKTEILSNSYI